MLVDNLVPDFGMDGSDLLPTVVVDYQDKEVLMVGVSSRQSFELTTKTGKTTFWSRERKCLWTKGETSGNFLFSHKILLSCEKKSLVVFVEPVGQTCHLGARSCFDDPITQEKRIQNKYEMCLGELGSLNFEKSNGNIMAVFQDDWSKDILWCGYINEWGVKLLRKDYGFYSNDAHSLQQDKICRNIDYYSKHFMDCDEDTILTQSSGLIGPFCPHNSTHSCFYEKCWQERVIWQR